MPPPPPPPPTLPDEILEEIFLRLPPDEPECLMRASLASKLWLGRVSAPRFRGRYRELHGAAPMLGFLCCSGYDRISKYSVPRFVSTGKFSARFPRGCRGYHVRDCRHGRVLLGNTRGRNMALAVWDPMTGRHTELDARGHYSSHGSAVLCAVNGCDHSACHDGPFRVVFVGLHTSFGACVAYTHASLPQMGRWSKPDSQLHLEGLHLGENALLGPMPPVLAEGALYFIIWDADPDYEEDVDNENVTILKYDLGSNCLSLIEAPVLEISIYGDIVLMAMKDGSLGFAHMDMSTLYLWSRQMGSDGVAAWSACRVIDLDKFLPIQNHMICGGD